GADDRARGGVGWLLAKGQVIGRAGSNVEAAGGRSRETAGAGLECIASPRFVDRQIAEGSDAVYGGHGRGAAESAAAGVRADYHAHRISEICGDEVVIGVEQLDGYGRADGGAGHGIG